MWQSITGFMIKNWLRIACGSRPHCVVSSVLNCDIRDSQFKLQWSYYVHFWTKILKKDMNPQSYRYGLNNTTTVLLRRWPWHLITQEVWRAFKQKNQTKRNLTKSWQWDEQGTTHRDFKQKSQSRENGDTLMQAVIFSRTLTPSYSHKLQIFSYKTVYSECKSFK